VRKSLIFCLLIAAVGLAAYSNTLHVPFQFDDSQQITDNAVIRDIDNFFSSSSGYKFNPRRFVGYITFALNYRFGGLDVTGYHIVNLAIHIINGLLVYLLVTLLFRTPYFTAESSKKSVVSSKQTATGDEIAIGSPVSANSYSLFTTHYSQSFLIALFSALLFVAHPVQTQAVTYIVQRLTSLATMFYLLSVISYIKGRLSSFQADKLTSAQTDVSASLQAGTLASYAFAIVFAICAMKTKEMTFTLPAVIVLCEFAFFGSALKKKLLFLIPVLLTLVVIPVSILGTHKPLGETLSDLSEKTRVQTDIPRWDYLMTQMRVITTYIRLIFFPVDQNLDYDYPIYRSLSDPAVAASFVFLVAILGTGGYLFYRSRQKQADKLTGEQADKPASQQANERGTTPHCPPLARGKANGNFVPSVIARDEVPQQSLDQRDCRASLAMTNNAFHNSLFTIHYSRLVGFGIFWFFITLLVESSLIPIADVIFEHRVYLPSVGAFIAITTSVFIIAERLRNRWRNAGKAAMVILSIIVISFAGTTYARNEVWQDEVSLWQDVVKKSPEKSRPHNDLGYLYLNRGLTDHAIEQFQIALKLNPRNADAHNNLGVAYYNKGRFDLSVIQFRTALSFASSKSELADAHHNLGIAYVRAGLLSDALREMKAALDNDPKNPEIYLIWDLFIRQWEIRTRQWTAISQL